MSFSSLLERADRTVQGHLGESLVYAPGSGVPVTVGGVFDSNYVLVDAGEAGASTAGPAAFVTLADLPSDPRLDKAARLTARGVVYSISKVERDGQGGAVLVLKRP